MDGARVVRVEVDENGDGKVDLLGVPPEPSDAAAAPAHAPQTGGQDDRTHRARHEVRRQSLALGNTSPAASSRKSRRTPTATAKMDKWETYADGSLSVMALDSQRTRHAGPSSCVSPGRFTRPHRSRPDRVRHFHPTQP